MSIIQTLLKTKLGFVNDTNIKDVIAENPQQLLIVRCGGGRFICTADNVEHFVAIIDKKHSEDYVRDVSIYTPPKN